MARCRPLALGGGVQVAPRFQAEEANVARSPGGLERHGREQVVTDVISGRLRDLYVTA